MNRCSCGGFVPRGITRCPNCGALSIKPSAGTVAGLAIAAQLITACACYGAPPVCGPAVHRGMAIPNSCIVADCVTPLPDGGNPRADPTDDLCADGSMNVPLDGG